MVKLHHRSAPKSPLALDQRILTIANAHTPDTPPRRALQWIPTAATLSVLVIAVLLVVQTPTPLLNDHIPFSAVKLTSDNDVDNDSAEGTFSPRTQSTMETQAIHRQPPQEKQSAPVLDKIWHTQSEASLVGAPAKLNASDHSLQETMARQYKSKPLAKRKESPKREIIEPQVSANSIPPSWAAKSLSSLSAQKSKTLRLIDSDKDGLPDNWERRFKFDKNNKNDAHADPDKDGLSNLEEYQHRTNPIQADSDNDLIPDGWEISHGLNPLVNDAENKTNTGQRYLDMYRQSLKKL
ncbi:hypothetical protein JYU12_01975 [bacterium AH-315-K03]|nr:hypothetical protein [bacterium AH-315-K03]